jgi:UDP-N-acetylmuramoyl-tripeptide--D-alanyl-D-alanine ligase
VFEIGMNHAGEIEPLVQMVRPHISVITTVEPVHLEFFAGIEAIADAKAEIFDGLEPDGVAILPNDTPHRDRLVKAARRHADRIVTFGTGDADVHAIHAVSAETGGSLISAALLERELTFTISQRGEHWVSNALAVLAAVEAVGEDVAVAALALSDLGGLKGRGERHRLGIDGGEIVLIDESYNANPASMAATLKSLGAEREVTRRIAVLGPMRELGAHSGALHAALAPAVTDAHVDRLILIGEEMRPLAEQVVGTISFDLVADVDEATDTLMHMVHPGDAVLVKASNSVGLAKLVERMVKGMPCST